MLRYGGSTKRWRYLLLCVVFLSLGSVLLLPFFDNKTGLDIVQEYFTAKEEGVGSVGAETTYYWNAYDSGGEEWTYFPAQMVDGNTANFAKTDTVSQVQLNDGNTYSSGGVGTITKVEIRAHAYTASAVANDLILRPVFSGTTDCAGSYIYVMTIGGAWSGWFDITSDGNAPSWSWSEINTLDMDVEADPAAGSKKENYVSKIELKVTYTEPNNAPTQNGEIPANQSTNISLTPVCNVTANDLDGDSLTVTFWENTTGSYVMRQKNSSVSANSSVQWDDYSNAHTANTKYWWKVYTDDGTDNTSEIYHFNTTFNITHLYSMGTNQVYNSSANASLNPVLDARWDVTENPPDDEVYITYYNASDDSFIGNSTVVESEGTTIYQGQVQWVDLSLDTAYSYYSKCNYSGVSETSPTQYFNTTANSVSYSIMYFVSNQTHGQGLDQTDHGGLNSTYNATKGFTYCAIQIWLWFDNPANITQNRSVEDIYCSYWFASNDTEEYYNNFELNNKGVNVWSDGLNTDGNYILDPVVDALGSSILDTDNPGANDTFYQYYWLRENLSIILNPDHYYDVNLNIITDTGNPASPSVLCHSPDENHSFILINPPDNATLKVTDTDGDGYYDYDEMYTYYTNPFYSNFSGETWQQNFSGWWTGGHIASYKQNFSGFWTGGNVPSYKQNFTGWWTGGNDIVNWKNNFTGWWVGGNIASYIQNFSGFWTGGNTPSYQSNFSGWWSGGNITVDVKNWQNNFSGYWTGGNTPSYQQNFTGFWTGGNTPSYQSNFSGYWTGGNTPSYQSNFSGWWSGGNITVDVKNWQNNFSGWWSGGNATRLWTQNFTGFWTGGHIASYKQNFSGFWTGGNVPSYKQNFTGFWTGGNTPSYQSNFSGFWTGGNVSRLFIQNFSGFWTGGNVSVFFDIINEYPNNLSNIYDAQPTIYFTITHPVPSSLCNYSILIGNSSANCTTYLYNGTNVSVGQQINMGHFYHTATDYYTTYFYSMVCTDGGSWVNETNQFRVVMQGGGSSKSTSGIMAIAIGGMGIGVVALLFAMRRRRGR